MLYYMDPTYLAVLIVSLIVGGAAQFWIRSQYRRYSAVLSDTGLAGAEVARRMLDAEGLGEVSIERVGGSLTDHYDPRVRVLRLSGEVYAGRSVAAAGIAAHEAGHAVQHARAFAVARLRQALVPVANIGSQASGFLIILGLVFRFEPLFMLGIVAFAAAVFFQFVTLPVELDASRRAVAAVGSLGLVAPRQVDGTRRVLRAAALTYVAAALVSVLYLLYYLGLARRS